MSQSAPQAETSERVSRLKNAARHIDRHLRMVMVAMMLLLAVGAGIGAVGGAVAGRAVGNAVTASTQPGVEITIRLESNLLMAVVQAGSSNEFRVGDSVRVTNDGQTTRVVRN